MSNHLSLIPPPEAIPTMSSEEATLLRLFRAIRDQVDRDYLITIMRLRTDAQKPIRPALAIVK